METPGERFAACNVVQVDGFDGGSVMVWAGICLGSRTDLYLLRPGGILNRIEIPNEVLEPNPTYGHFLLQWAMG